MGLMEALIFLFKVQFWRMAVIWTLSLFLSYLQLFSQTNFSRKSKFNDSSSSTSSVNASIRKPICIITGATSGLGAAVSHALAKEGYYVVLGVWQRNLGRKFWFPMWDINDATLQW